MIFLDPVYLPLPSPEPPPVTTITLPLTSKRFEMVKLDMMNELLETDVQG